VPDDNRQPSLAEQAYEVLEHLLVTLQLPPGAIVSEAQLNERVGLGRTPVREAMQRLAQQDLIHVMPRKGLLIKPVDPAALLQVLEARRPLERQTVRLAALNARDEQRSALAAIARALAVSHDRHDEFLRLEIELDELLDTCAGNPYLRAALAPLRTHCRRFWFLHRERLPLSEVITALGSMVRLVARRDFNGALKASDAAMAVMERMAGGAQSQGGGG
jgi:DNA-binding GntR family transcriptional regulator